MKAIKSKDVYRAIPESIRPNYNTVNSIFSGRRPAAQHGNVVAVLKGLEVLMNSRLEQVVCQFSEVRNRILSVTGGVVEDSEEEVKHNASAD